MAHSKCSVTIVFHPNHKRAPILGSLLYSLLIEYLKESTVSGDQSLAAERTL